MVSLTETQPGIFGATLVGNMPGIYRFNIVAKGVTYKGAPFTREQILNAAIFRGQVVPPPRVGTDPTRDEQLCRLLECLLKEDSLQKFFKQHGLDIDSIAKCVHGFCRERVRTPGRSISPGRALSEVLANPRWSDIPGLVDSLRKRGTDRN